ncbi:Histone acetyltransferase type B catalytic subunit [Colletotrichum tanaceti]|nr:Histone acetyltransferase type B catalytic subunit [Colletotrichum tanaceti]
MPRSQERQVGQVAHVVKGLVGILYGQLESLRLVVVMLKDGLVQASTNALALEGRQNEELGKPRAAGQLLHPPSGTVPKDLVDQALLGTLRQKTKIVERQFKRLVEMQTMSQLPASVKVGFGEEQKARPTKEENHHYHLWQLFVKQRLYRQNADVLGQLDQSERLEKLNEALSSVELEYARLLDWHARWEKNVAAASAAGAPGTGSKLDFGEPCPQQPSKRAGQVLEIVDDEVVLEGEGVEVPLDDDAAVAALVLDELGLLEVQDAVALLVARVVHDDEDDHDALLHGLAEQAADGLVLRRRRQAVRQDQGELPQVLGAAAGRVLQARGAEVVDGPAHEQRDVGAVLLEVEVLHDLGSRIVRGERLGEVVCHEGVGPEAEDADLADLEHGQRARDHDEGLEGQRAGARLAHAARVVDAEEDLVATLGRDGAAHPDLVALVAGRDVRDDLLDVEALARAVRARELCGLGRGEDEPELGGEGERKRVRLGLERRPGPQRLGEVAKGKLLVADVGRRELRRGFLNGLLIFRVLLLLLLFGSLDLVLRGRYLALESALSRLDAGPAIVLVGTGIFLLDFGGFGRVHLVRILVHLGILRVGHHSALWVFLLFINGHRLVDGLHLIFGGVAHGLGVGRSFVVLEVLELASAELHVDVPRRLLLLALFLLLLLGILDVVLLAVPTLEGIAELLERILSAGIRRIILVLLALLPGAGLLLRGPVSCVSVVPLGSVGVEVVLDVHLVGVLILAAALDVARCGVGVGFGVVPRGFHAVVGLLGLIGLLFLLCLGLRINLGLAREVLLWRFLLLLLFFLAVMFGTLLIGSLRLFFSVLDVRLLLLLLLRLVLLDFIVLGTCIFSFIVEVEVHLLGHRQRVVLLHILVLLDLIVLELRVFLLRAWLFLFFFLLLVPFFGILLVVLCLTFLGVGLGFSRHLLVHLLPLGLVALLVLLCIVFASAVPHLLVNGRGIEIIDIADLFFHFVLLLTIFAFSVGIFLLVVSTNTAHLSLELFIRHIDGILLVFHLAVLFFVRLLGKLGQVLIGLDVFANVLRSIAVSQTGSGFEFARFARLLALLLLRRAEALGSELNKGSRQLAMEFGEASAADGGVLLKNREHNGQERRRKCAQVGLLQVNAFQGARVFGRAWKISHGLLVLLKRNKHSIAKGGHRVVEALGGGVDVDASLRFALDVGLNAEPACDLLQDEIQIRAAKAGDQCFEVFLREQGPLPQGVVLFGREFLRSRSQSVPLLRQLVDFLQGGLQVAQYRLVVDRGQFAVDIDNLDSKVQDGLHPVHGDGRAASVGGVAPDGCAAQACDRGDGPVERGDGLAGGRQRAALTQDDSRHALHEPGASRHLGTSELFRVFVDGGSDLGRDVDNLVEVIVGGIVGAVLLLLLLLLLPDVGGGHACQDDREGILLGQLLGSEVVTETHLPHHLQDVRKEVALARLEVLDLILVFVRQGAGGLLAQVRNRSVEILHVREDLLGGIEGGVVSPSSDLNHGVKRVRGVGQTLMLMEPLVQGHAAGLDGLDVNLEMGERVFAASLERDVVSSICDPGDGDLVVRDTLLQDGLHRLAEDGAELADKSEKLQVRLARALAQSVDVGVLPAGQQNDFLHRLLERRPPLGDRCLGDLLEARVEVDEVQCRVGHNGQGGVVDGEQLQVLLQLSQQSEAGGELADDGGGEVRLELPHQVDGVILHRLGGVDERQGNGNEDLVGDEEPRVGILRALLSLHVEELGPGREFQPSPADDGVRQRRVEGRRAVDGRSVASVLPLVDNAVKNLGQGLGVGEVEELLASGSHVCQRLHVADLVHLLQVAEASLHLVYERDQAANLGKVGVGVEVVSGADGVGLERRHLLVHRPECKGQHSAVDALVNRRLVRELLCDALANLVANLWERYGWGRLLQEDLAVRLGQPDRHVANLLMPDGGLLVLLFVLVELLLVHLFLVFEASLESVEVRPSLLRLAVVLEPLGPLLEEPVDAFEQRFTDTGVEVRQSLNGRNQPNVVEELQAPVRELLEDMVLGVAANERRQVHESLVVRNMMLDGLEPVAQRQTKLETAKDVDERPGHVLVGIEVVCSVIAVGQAINHVSQVLPDEIDDLYGVRRTRQGKGGVMSRQVLPEDGRQDVVEGCLNVGELRSSGSVQQLCRCWCRAKRFDVLLHKLDAERCPLTREASLKVQQ